MYSPAIKLHNFSDKDFKEDEIFTIETHDKDGTFIASIKYALKDDNFFILEEIENNKKVKAPLKKR